MYGKGFYFYLQALLAWGGRIKENICPVKQQDFDSTIKINLSPLGHKPITAKNSGKDLVARGNLDCLPTNSDKCA